MNEVLSMGRPWDLARAWERLRAEEPGVRAREAARKLGASEAELVASGCGTSAVRLGPNFGAGAETVGTESQRIVSIGGELTEIVYVRPLMVLKEGRVLTAGPPERALTRDALLRAYGVDVDVLPGPLGVLLYPRTAVAVVGDRSV